MSCIPEMSRIATTDCSVIAVPKSNLSQVSLVTATCAASRYLPGHHSHDRNFERAGIGLENRVEILRRVGQESTHHKKAQGSWNPYLQEQACHNSECSVVENDHQNVG
jgi:hypothetical protein